MILAKEHVSDQGMTILALCDGDLLGKRFEENRHQIDCTSSFYRGVESTKEEIKNAIKHIQQVNAVGKEAIGLLKELGLVEHVITIDGIPHAQSVIEKD